MRLRPACAPRCAAARRQARSPWPACSPPAPPPPPRGPRRGPRPKCWSSPRHSPACTGWRWTSKGRLLAGTVAGSSMWEVNRQTGEAHVFIAAPEGEADDIAIGPQGEMAWTGFNQGVLRYRDNDNAPTRVLAKGLPGINSVAFDKKTGKLYASQVFLGDALWEIDRAGPEAPAPDQEGHGRLQRLRGRPGRHALRPAVVQGPGGQDRPGRRRADDDRRRLQDPRCRQPGRQGQPVGAGHAQRRAGAGGTGQRQEDGRQAAQAVAGQPGHRARRHPLRLQHGRQLGAGLQPRHRRAAHAHQRRRGRADRHEGRGRPVVGGRRVRDSARWI